MDIFNTYATDEIAEVEGRWHKIGKDAQVLVARTGNTKYTAAFRKALADSDVDLANGGEEADRVAEEMLVDVLARTVLLDWKGLSFHGAAVDYSIDMAKTMLRVKDFRKRITNIADSLENFRIRIEEAQGNA